MEINFHGVRGSFPVPGESTNKYGGNTTCVSITKNVNGKIIRLIFDCGTGAIGLGKEIIGNYFAGKEDLNIKMFFTHLHPDHTQAFPFFAPNYFPECTAHLLGMKTLKKHIGVVLEQSMLPPTFPIEYKDLKSTRKHYELKDGTKLYIGVDGQIQKTNVLKDPVFKIEVMQSYAPSHPQQGCLYYKVTECGHNMIDNKTVVCAWDLESKVGGDKAVINFAKGADYLIHDTQYTYDEYSDDQMIVQGFGHSTYDMAIENAELAGVKNLICTHFNPTHSDEKLDTISNVLSEKNDLNIQLAYEGLSIII